MEIYQRLEDIKDRPAVALAIGSFDGLHRGHQSIIDHVREEAGKRRVKSMIMTFSPTPREVLGTDHEVALMRAEEKIAHLRAMSIDILCLIAFNKDLANTGRDDFIQGLLTYLDLKVLVAGPDHHIGNRHEGGIAYLKEVGAIKGFDLVVVPKAREISSQLIRKKLKEGRIEDVNAMLGYPYRLSGKVIRGDQRGRLLGFPTMNIQPDPGSCVIPAMGVYCVRVLMEGQSLPGVCNIGMRPTFSADRLSLEVHVMDAKLDPQYDKAIAVQFECFVRKEKKFDSNDALIEQIRQDIEKCKKILTEEKCQV